MMQKIVALILITAVIACTSAKEGVVKKSESSCDTLVTVIDYSGLDGCGFLLVDQSGSKFLPIDYPKNIQFKAGLQYNIGYKVIPDGLSVCMTESNIISIFCAEIANADCEASTSGIDDKMLKKRIDQQNIQRIIRYNFNGTWVYKINTDGKSEFINCQGVSLCPSFAEGIVDCFNSFKPMLSEEKIIYQGEGPQE